MREISTGTHRSQVEGRVLDLGDPMILVIIESSMSAHNTVCEGLRKLISRLARVRSKEASLENLADPSKLGDMDDPKAMARWAKEMGKSLGDETGEDLGEDFDEMLENQPGEDSDEE